MRTIHRAAVALLTSLLLIVGLTGCANTPAPDEVEWEKVAEGPIVAMDSSTGVYVSGYMNVGLFGGHGEIESEGVIDYKYARELDDGGIREDLVSTTYQRFVPDSLTYPGSHVVTIYQDAEPDGSDARIEIFACALPEDSKAVKDWDIFGVTADRLPRTCETPAGTQLDRNELRVDVHVPSGSVVESFGETPEEDG